MTEEESAYQKELEYIEDQWIDLSSQLLAVTTVLGIVVEAANLESEVCSAFRDETLWRKLVPAAELAEEPRTRISRQLYLANQAWSEAFSRILEHDPRHLQYPHDCD